MPKGRPEKLTSDLKARIAAIQKQRVDKGKPFLKAPAMRRELLRRYHDNLKKQGLANGDITRELNRADKKLFPGVDCIRGYLHDLNPELKEPKEIDKIWHLGLLGKGSLEKGSLEKYDMSPEAITYILRVQNWVSKQKGIHPVTIREAKWISRLYDVIENNKNRWHKPLEHALWKVAVVYAAYEMIYEISNTGTEVDTRDIDKHLLKGEREFTLETVYKNTVIDKAFEAALYQYKGIGTAKHYLKYKENAEKEVNNEGPHKATQ